MEMIGIIQCLSRGDTELDLLALRILFFRIVEIIRRDQPQPILFCQRRQYRTHIRFFRDAMILQLEEIVLLPERIDVVADHLSGFIHVAV